VTNTEHRNNLSFNFYDLRKNAYWNPSYLTTLSNVSVVDETSKEHWWNDDDVLGEEPVPVLLCPAKITHGLTWDWTWASAVTDHLLNTLTIAPFMLCINLLYYKIFVHNIPWSWSLDKEALAHWRLLQNGGGEIPSSSYLISLINFHKSVFSCRVTVFVRMPRKKRKRNDYMTKHCESLGSKIKCSALNGQGSMPRQDTGISCHHC
jgi:hypothetical protein